MVDSIDKLVSYVDALSGFSSITPSQNASFQIGTDKLREISQQVKVAKQPFITDSDIVTIQNLGDQLANDPIHGYFYSSSIQKRLGILWSLCKDILTQAKPLDIILWRDAQHPRSNTSLESLPRLQNVANTTSLITNTILSESERDILTLASVLLMMVLRTEASEFELTKIIDFAKKYVSVSSTPEDLVSVDNKVGKGSRWKSDIRAIRDATAHARFGITPINGNLIVSFENKEEGYNFVKQMNKAQLLHFYQDFDRMTIIQTRLFSIVLLISFLRQYFK